MVDILIPGRYFKLLVMHTIIVHRAQISQPYLYRIIFPPTQNAKYMLFQYSLR